MRPVKCPKCGKFGSEHLKMVRNNYGAIYYYFYIAHYNGVYYKKGKRYRKIKWHYVGKIAITPFASKEEQKEELERGIKELLGEKE